jgi:MFS family permease
MVLLFAFCCGAIVANIYYAQPIIGLIAPDIGLTSTMASLIVSLTQIGYALGLFFLVPLGDLLENRRLMIITTVVAIASLGRGAHRSAERVLADFATGGLQLGVGADPDTAGRTPGAGRISRPRGRRDHGRFVVGDLAGATGVQRGGGSFWLAGNVCDCRAIDGSDQHRIGADHP